MAHRYLFEFLFCLVCLAAVVLSVNYMVRADDGSSYSARPESFAVFAAGVGLTGIGFIARRRIRSKVQ